jgi:DeoR/GlpR family transcriptional regulator of sugar metabolism
MLPEQRRRKILELIQQGGAVDVVALSGSLSVSGTTIRRDLRDLEARGMLSRTHGGAVANLVSTSFEPIYKDKSRERREEKAAIAAYACGFVRDGEVVALDSGSTTFALARELKRRLRELTVITTDLQIAVDLCDTPGFDVILTGGSVRPQLYSVVGPMAEDALTGLHANHTFIGADAVDLDAGVTNANLEEVGVKQRVMAVAEQVVLLVDHTKFGKAGLARIAPLASFDMVVVDADLDGSVAKRYREAGIDVRLAH